MWFKIEKNMPKEEGMDHTFSFMREGYMYIMNRRRSLNTDVFETRLLGEKVICIGGKKAAEVFYDNEKFKRKNAAPNRAVQTLFGKNGVQLLDGKKHKHRKQMFMSLMTSEELNKLTDIAKKQWEKALEQWEQMDQVIFYEEAKEILCRTACEWTGIPVHEQEVKNLTRDLGAMFESAGAVGPKHWKGRAARNRVERQIQKIVVEVQNGSFHPPEDTVLYHFSRHRDLERNLLDAKTVAVEVINILRPLVAIAIYINFILLTLHYYPEEKEKLETGDETYPQMFIQEVRRFYPFFPFVMGRVKKDFTWNGYLFKKDTLTLLDIYGTNHDPLIWENPDVFNPRRFARWNENPFDFIPQGGGDHFIHHRCAGEWITQEIMKVSLDFLVHQFDYEVPDQDLSYSLVHVPCIPRSRIIIKNVKKKT